MKIVISSLPKKPWWSDGIIGYKDNPFMKNGTVPNQNLLIKERLNLIATLKKNKIEVIEFPFPKILEESKFGHDYVFMRDSFISDLNGNVLMLKFAEKKREAETEIVANELEKLNFNLKELPTEKSILAEGGEFYFCPKDKLLFSGLNRNTIGGAEYVASFLNANELILIDTPSFHLDTVFTTVFDKQGTLSAMIVCEELITKDSFKNLEKISVELNVHIITIPAKDSIGTDNQLGSLAVNSFCAPGLLISSSNYSDFSVGKKLESLGVKTEVCPVSQFQLSGGSVHCLTNEL